MATPWFDPNTFGALYGAIGGGVGGSLAGVLGALAGWLAPKGKGKTLVVGGMALVMLAGIASLIAGLYALVAGQPYGIWYPMLLLGLIFTLVIGINLPMILGRYAEAENRRLEADGIRNG